MGLYERILGIEQPKLKVHGLSGCLLQIAQGRLTVAQVAAAFALTPAEQAELQTLVNTFTGNAASRSIKAADVHFTLMIAESGEFYSTVQALKGELGVA